MEQMSRYDGNIVGNQGLGFSLVSQMYFTRVFTGLATTTTTTTNFIEIVK